MTKFLIALILVCTLGIFFLLATAFFDSLDHSLHIYDEGIADSRSVSE